MSSVILELGFYVIASIIGIGPWVYIAWKENRLNW